MTDEEVLQYQESIQQDPNIYMESALGCEFWSMQKKIAKSVFLYPCTSVRSCHSSGKSHAAARIGQAFLYAHTDSIVVTTAPTFRQVEHVIWREWRGAYHTAKIDLGGRLLKTLHEISENWYAIGLSAKEPDKVQGIHSKSGHILVIIDEADGVPNDIIMVVQGLLTSANVHLLLIGNPVKNFGAFYESYTKDNLYKCFKISVFDTPNFTQNNILTLHDLKKYTREELAALPLPYPSLVTPVWVYDRINDWGEDSPMFQSRVLAEPPTEGEYSLFKLSSIEDATRKVFTDQQWKMRPMARCIGIDVARFGSNDTVLIALDWKKLVGYGSHNGKDTMKTVGRAVRMFEELGWNKQYDYFAVDDIGVGGGVTDRLVELGYIVIPVNVAESPTTEVSGMPVRNVPKHVAKDELQFQNLKAEIYWYARQQFLDGEIRIEEVGKIFQHLLMVEYDFTSSGKLIIVNKKKTKDSPDWAEALVIAMWGARNRHDVVRIDPDVGKSDSSDNSLSSLHAKQSSKRF